MKKFRILRVSHLAYPQALIALLQKYPDIQQKPYIDQAELFFSEKLVYSNSFSRAMRQLGHEADEVVYDVEWLQKTWAKEHSVSYSETDWQQEILLAQIEFMRPEILYFQHSPPLSYSVWKNLKQAYPFIQKIVVHRAFPGDFGILGAADLLMVGTKHLVSQYADHGIQARLLYHYFDEAVLDFIGQPQVLYPITFLGSSGHGYAVCHATRYWLLKELLERTPIEMWLDEKPASQSKVLQYSKILVTEFIVKPLLCLPLSMQHTLANSSWVPHKIRSLLEAHFNYIDLHSNNASQLHIEDKLKTYLKEPRERLLDLFPQRCHSALFGLDFYRVLAQSQISFNCHTDYATGEVGNIRMFQATGMGSCLLTDTGNNISDLFEADTEVVTYSSKEEALEKVKYLLENETKCREIAVAGHKRTMRDHTALKRCEQIDEWLQEI